MKSNTLIIGDDGYKVDASYRAGAEAMRNGIPYSAGNPHRAGSDRHDQWNHGHTNEAACEHLRFGADIISEPLTGQVFAEDPSVPRDEFGVSKDWYRAQLR